MKNIPALLMFCILICSMPAYALDPACGDGSVPKGVWPNCDPCAGAGASAGVAEKVNRLRDKMDQAVQPQSFDFVKDCLASMENLFYGNMGIPSLEDLLGALCLATRYATQEAVNKLNQSNSVSYLGGSLTANMGAGNSASGGIRVQDTSAQARTAAAGLLRR